MAWKDDFVNYTTGTAFSLSLSRDMVDFLLMFDEVGMQGAQGFRRRNGVDGFVPIAKALGRRGLFEHNSDFSNFSYAEKEAHNIRAKWIYRITPAGELVVNLLKIQRGIKNDP